MKPEEAYNVDVKLDDGKPATGMVAARAAGLSNCTDTVSNNGATLTANYLLSATGPTCALYFRNLF